MLHTISYVSTSKELSDFQINELLYTTKLKNEDLGITGILMYSDYNFFQIIEGEKKVIQYLYQKIKRDIRHFNLIKILDRSINIPSFTSFQSTYTIINREKDYPDLQQFLEVGKVYNPKNFQNISYLVNKFMKLA
ncbi:BLUF domain-containing protein [uncultured Aquimarina sp.]|jgi:hypothetical protein|uniref:BLUF domain-containing protein n=1 Tax=uncultured Aquimarina sp. TaxID=575652 RepID=UPI00260534F2|nr:BLUF domain-containing protein [uncultured Aquimarina sp.]